MSNQTRLLAGLASALIGAYPLHACVVTTQQESVHTAVPVATAVPVSAASEERPDHQCGPAFGGASCGPGRCCSRFNWCGGQGEDHCGVARGYAGRFDGPGAPQM